MRLEAARLQSEALSASAPIWPCRSARVLAGELSRVLQRGAIRDAL